MARPSAAQAKAERIAAEHAHATGTPRPAWRCKAPGCALAGRTFTADTLTERDRAYWQHYADAHEGQAFPRPAGFTPPATASDHHRVIGCGPTATQGATAA